MGEVLDPIVVNPPKEKTVQTYNDKDIEHIVTRGINNGNIPLPEIESGSKLYKHDVHWDNNNPNKYFIFFSPSNEPITTGTLLIQKLKNGEFIYCGFYAYGNGYYINQFAVSGNNLVLYYVEYATITQFGTFESSEVLNDIVTEL